MQGVEEPAPPVPDSRRRDFQTVLPLSALRQNTSSVVEEPDVTLVRPYTLPAWTTRLPRPPLSPAVIGSLCHSGACPASEETRAGPSSTRPLRPGPRHCDQSAAGAEAVTTSKAAENSLERRIMAFPLG